MGSATRPEEPFAYTAREFLRNKIVGKKCVFTVEYTFQNKEFGVLIIDGDNMNLAIVGAGLGQVLERKAGTAADPYVESLQKAQQDAKNKSLGVWSKDSVNIKKNTRSAIYYQDSAYNSQEMVANSKKITEPVEGIVEYVFSANFISVYIPRFNTVSKLAMNFLFTPATDKLLVAEGKVFVEKFILGRSVGVKLDRVEENGNVYARIHHPAGDIAYEIVKNGYSKLNQPKTTDFDADYFKSLKEAETIAKAKRSGIWEHFIEEEKKQEKASEDDFVGHVIEIHSGDSISIQREGDI